MANFASKVWVSGGNAIETIKVTATANATLNFQPGHPIKSMTLMALGGGGNNFGGGTVELKCSNDGVTFFSLPTAKTLAADGVASVALIDQGFMFYQISLTNSTSPTLTIWVNIDYNQLG